jgi:hypothetical protein
MKAHLFLTCLLLGCVPKADIKERDPLSGNNSGSASGPLALSVKLLVPGDDGDTPIVGDDPFHSGAQFAIEVSASQAAYLNARLLSPSGKPEVLFPDAGFNRIPSHCPIRIPSRGWLYMQGPTGPENLRIVASTTPLEQADPILCQQVLQAGCGVKAMPARQVQCGGPAGPVQATRGGLNPLVKHSESTSSGVASVSVTLQHVP